jgi:hypothetical protein
MFQIYDLSEFHAHSVPIQKEEPEQQGVDPAS